MRSSQVPSSRSSTAPVRKKSAKPGSQTIAWWVLWIAATIGSFFVAVYFWTPIIAKHFGSVHETKNSVIWVSAVFGTWLVILIPLIVVMYSKVDKAYEDARISRENAAMRFRTTWVEPSKRMIPANLKSKLNSIPDTIAEGKLLRITLNDGSTVPFIFADGNGEILGVYDQTELSFEGSNIADLEEVKTGEMPSFLVPNWLRLDGVKPPQ